MLNVCNVDIDCCVTIYHIIKYRSPVSSLSHYQFTIIVTIITLSYIVAHAIAKNGTDVHCVLVVVDHKQLSMFVCDQQIA